MPNERLCSAINSLDSASLNPEYVDILLRFIPTDDDKKKYRGCKFQQYHIVGFALVVLDAVIGLVIRYSVQFGYWLFIILRVKRHLLIFFQLERLINDPDNRNLGAN